MSDIWDAFLEIFNSPEGIAALLGGVAGGSGLFDGGDRSVGYQGGIPRYRAVQRTVPHADLQPGQTHLRTPGSQGRRYFTDTFYGIVPEEQQAPLSNFDANNKAEQQLSAILDGRNYNFNSGGIASLAPNMNFLTGTTDGMADQIPATIDNKQPANLSDGEFVIPADVVSHLGNGNSNAGAKKLYHMLDRVRAERTGKTRQAPQINPDKFLS